MRRYRVQLEGSAETTARHRIALASLPEHFETVESEPDSVLASGLAVEPGVTVVVAADPLIVPETEAVALPAMRFASRLFSAPMARSPQPSSYLLYDSLVRLDRSGTDGLRAALLEQLAVLRLIEGDGVRLIRFLRVGDGYLAEGALPNRSATAALTGVGSGAPGPAFTLIAAGLDRRLEIQIDDAAIARPARLLAFDVDGALTPSLTHQSSDRLTWLAAHAILSGKAAVSYGGDAWRNDLAEVNRVVGQPWFGGHA